MNKIIIAIDGHSSTGKSTTAKAVAKALGYVYIDTGAMYRAATLIAIRKGLIALAGVAEPDGSTKTFTHIDADSLLAALKKSQLTFKYNPDLGYAELFLDGENIEKEIRSLEVANAVSEVAKLPAVRAFLVDLQREMGKAKGVVMDGRDIGTVVFPNAELKIFMTASEQIRAERRFKELQAKDPSVRFADVLANIQPRDPLDSTRTESPLRKAPDAVVIDNSNMTIDEQVQAILERVKSN
jgi:cytidylate kinase